MISYSLFWIETLYLQICSSGELTLLNYTKESHWAGPFISSQKWTVPSKPQSGTDGTCVALRPDPGFPRTPRISLAPTPDCQWFLTNPYTCPIQAPHPQPPPLTT